MITSNISEILYKAELQNKEKATNGTNSFINALEDTQEKSQKTDELSYENIKGISLEQIDELFLNEEDKNMAKNLRLATLFTKDETLGKAMFNTVLGKPFELGHTFLFDRYEDKHSFLNSKDSNTLSELLHKSVSNKLYDEKKANEQISQDRLDEVLLEINSFSFLDAFSKTSKDQYGRYKDKDEDYSFLYNDYHLKYQELIYKYEHMNDINEKLIQQFR